MPKLLIKKKSKDEYIANYLDGISFNDECKYESDILNMYPESKQKCLKRAKIIAERLKG